MRLLLICCLFSIFFFVILQELKAVLLGTSLNCFSVEWRNQPFTFSEIHDLRYGIVQRKVIKYHSSNAFILLQFIELTLCVMCYNFIFVYSFF